MKEVKKKKVDVKPRKTQQLLENEFNESLAVIKPLLQKINETDRKIDEIVCDLYGLTNEKQEILKIINFVEWKTMNHWNTVNYKCVNCGCVIKVTVDE